MNNLRRTFWGWKGRLFYFKFLNVLIYLWRGGREGERERNANVGREHQCETETWTGCLSYVPGRGTKPTTQARALTQS